MFIFLNMLENLHYTINDECNEQTPWSWNNIIGHCYVEELKFKQLKGAIESWVAIYYLFSFLQVKEIST